jgi:type II secretory pathway component GspD/PulD (secretin)
MMRFATIGLGRGHFALLLFLAASVYSQELTLDQIQVTLKLKDRPLREAINQIYKQTKIQFVFNDALVEKETVSCDCEAITLRIALYELLKHTSINYQFVNERQIVLVKSQPAQTTRLKGFILNTENNEPLPFAKIFLNGTKFSTQSNDAGYFELENVPLGNHTIQVDYLGAKSQKLPIITRPDVDLIKIHWTWTIVEEN